MKMRFEIGERVKIVGSLDKIYPNLEAIVLERESCKNLPWPIMNEDPGFNRYKISVYQKDKTFAVGVYFFEKDLRSLKTKPIEEWE